MSIYHIGQVILFLQKKTFINKMTDEGTVNKKAI